MKFLIINGPNLNFLGIREPKIYGTKTFSELEAYIRASCDEAGVECELFFSNSEGDIVDKIQYAYGVPFSECAKFDGIVINPAAYSHTSIAIRDAILAVGIPTAEVHLSNTDKREEFRRVSRISPVCLFTVKGKGFEGYREAVFRLKNQICDKNAPTFI